MTKKIEPYKWKIPNSKGKIVELGSSADDTNDRISESALLEAYIQLIYSGEMPQGAMLKAPKEDDEVEDEHCCDCDYCGYGEEE